MIPWVPRPTRGKAALGPQTTTQRTWRRDLSTLKTRKVACKPEIWIASSGYRALDVNLEIPEGEEVKLAPQSRCRPRFLFARYQFARGSHKTKPSPGKNKACTKPNCIVQKTISVVWLSTFAAQISCSIVGSIPGPIFEKSICDQKSHFKALSRVFKGVKRPLLDVFKAEIGPKGGEKHLKKRQ